MKCMGVVVEGSKMAGRVYGLPTANLSVDVNLEPGAAYAGHATVDGTTYDAIIYYGIDNHVLEAHLFGFSGNLIGKTIVVETVKKVSDFVSFVSVEQMKKKIQRDIELVKEALCSPE